MIVEALKVLESMCPNFTFWLSFLGLLVGVLGGGGRLWSLSLNVVGLRPNVV